MARITLGFLTIASPVLLLTCGVGRAGEIVFAVLTMAFPFALIAIGARSRGGRGRLPLILGGLLAWYEICLVALLVSRGGTGPWILGLPFGAAVQVYGLFVLPLLWVPLTYALTFDRYGLDREALADLRRRARSGP